jgi:hypothetical protein
VSAVVSKRTLLTAFLVAATTGSAACRVGTSLPVEEPAELVADEATAISNALLAPALTNSIFSANHVSFMHQHGVQSIHEHPVAGPWIHERTDEEGPLLSHHNLFQFDLTVEPECGAGGSLLMEAAVTGEGNPAVGVGAVHYVMIQTPQGCALPLAQVGEFFLNASPYLTVEAHAVNDGSGTVTIHGIMEGGVAWQAENKAGSCLVELIWEGAGPSLDEIEVVAVSGSFCNLDGLAWLMTLD